MIEKRKSQRHPIAIPMVVESKSRYFHVSQSRNLAVAGVQVKMDTELAVGEAVNITYDIHRVKTQDYDASGRVVRVERNYEEDKDMWPYLAAVAFVRSYPQIATYVMRNVQGGKASS